jgi:hypothetical protein
MGEPPPTAVLVAPSSRTLGVVAGAISAIIGAVNLTAIAAAADQRLAAASHAHKLHRPEQIATRGRLKAPPEAGEFAT